MPGNLHSVPADLEVESVADVLRRSAYDPSQAAFFAWLGVLSYLTRSAIESTFTTIRHCAPRGSQIVFDYLTALAFVPERQSLAIKLRFDRARVVGEPYLTGFAPTELSAFSQPLATTTARKTWANPCIDTRYPPNRRRRHLPVDTGIAAYATMRPEQHTEVLASSSSGSATQGMLARSGLLLAKKQPSLNLSGFVADRSGPSTGQIALSG